MQGERVLSMEEIAAMGEAIAETAAIIDVATHRFQMRLLPEEAAVVMKALALMGDGNRADGAVAMAEAALGGRLEEEGASVRLPVEVVVHVEANDLEGRTELGDRISAETARRLLCDAGVVAMLEDERGKTIDVGRKTRTIPAALRRALEARDGGCRFPGCTNRLFVDAHHLEHWIAGGATSLDNTVLLCRRHHRTVHEQGFSLERVGEALVFRDPRGKEVPAHGARDLVAVDPAAVAARWRGAPVTAGVNAPGWDGERVDYDLCVGALG